MICNHDCIDEAGCRACKEQGRFEERARVVADLEHLIRLATPAGSMWLRTAIGRLLRGEHEKGGEM